MGDITDGNVLMSSMSPDKEPSNILGLLINIDWFQPYKDISYKEEYVIIIGIIPGPREPKKHINSYLGPLVSELLELYCGAWFSTSIGKQFVRCVLMCLSSDITATRKAVANKACSRCLKSFPKVGDTLDFERESSPVRTDVIHH